MPRPDGLPTGGRPRDGLPSPVSPLPPFPDSLPGRPRFPRPSVGTLSAAAGPRPGVPSFTRRVAIGRSPEQVFAVLDDLEAARRWMPAIRRIDVLTPGMPMGAGFKWRETRRAFGVLRLKVVLTVVQHHRPSTWGLMSNDGKVQATATFELEPAGGGTEVTLTVEAEDLRGDPRRAERTIRLMERQDAGALERLKAYVESTTEPPARAEPPPKALASAPTAAAERAAAVPAKARKGARKPAAGGRAKTATRKAK
jgi:uncharacterized protein YndB with AHSA1/START domain